MKRGLIHICTEAGKEKTTATPRLISRACGYGMRAVLIRGIVTRKGVEF